MLVVTRYRVPEAEWVTFEGEARAALAVLAGQEGYRRGHLGRNVDDRELWLLSTEWRNVGAYRRALSSYDVKSAAVPVMLRAVDEPSAYEVVATEVLGAGGDG